MSDVGNLNGAASDARKRHGGQGRRSSIGIWANWRGIVARAESIFVSGNELVVVVRATGAVAVEGKVQAHDYFHAQVVAMVFREQPSFQSLSSVRAFLKDRRGAMTEIRLNLPQTKRITGELVGQLRGGTQSNAPIPAPLVRFLHKQRSLRWQFRLL